MTAGNDGRVLVVDISTPPGAVEDRLDADGGDTDPGPASKASKAKKNKKQSNKVKAATRMEDGVSGCGAPAPARSRVRFWIDHGCGPNHLCTGTVAGVGYIAVADPSTDISLYTHVMDTGLPTGVAGGSCSETSGVSTSSSS